MKEGNLEEAEELFTELLAALPHDWWLWEGRANTYGQLGQWDKAAADIAQAVNLAPQRSIP